MAPKLTIGMATYDDFNGVYFSVQSLRLHHPEAMPQCELVVVDNNPDSVEGANTRDFLKWVKGDVQSVRYVPHQDGNGTAAPRNRIFALAQSDAVLVMDCHVLIPPGNLARLIQWYDYLEQRLRSGWPTTTPPPSGEPGPYDLYSGPMLYDDLRNRATHFADQWRGEMWGVWARDKRGDPFAEGFTGEPFEIPAMGLGLFTCRRDAWLGFNERFRGFGGEEFYIHEKFRQAGRACYCLPWLTWLHRFSRPGGVKYPLRRLDKVRNYLIGHLELGLSLEKLHEHFVTTKLITVDMWQTLLDEQGVSYDPVTPQPAQVALPVVPAPLSPSLLAVLKERSVQENALAVLGNATDKRPSLAMKDLVAAVEKPDILWLLVRGWGNRGPVLQLLKQHKEWVAVHRSHEGFLLSRRPEDREQPPGLLRKGLNFTKALAKHAASGGKIASDEVFEQRLSECLLCEHRNMDACGRCGCPVEKKASWASEKCPDKPPRW